MTPEPNTLLISVLGCGLAWIGIGLWVMCAFARKDKESCEPEEKHNN